MGTRQPVPPAGTRAARIWRLGIGAIVAAVVIAFWVADWVWGRIRGMRSAWARRSNRG